MPIECAYGFVDGAHIRKMADDAGWKWIDPKQLVSNVLCDCGSGIRRATRITYYDAQPEDPGETNPELVDYWNAIELLDDTQLGFGIVRGEHSKKPRQKRVDTLLATDMLVGAFTQIYTLAVLIAGDADFVPIVHEVQRRGVTVIVAGEKTTLSPELKRAADRRLEINTASPDESGLCPPLKHGRTGKTWPTAR